MRKMLVKRLVLFLVLAFGITWGASFLCRLLFSDPEEAGRTGLFSIVGMMGPALGHLLTRLLTREGWQETYLGLLGDNKGESSGQKKTGKWLDYHIAVWGQSAMILASAVLLCLYIKIPVSLQYSGAYSIGLLLFNAAVGFAGLFVYFGEEWGWRGYLFPKLRQLTGTVPALIISGIIWGVWHLPSLLEGLNFGTDLPGYPVSNVLLMCVYCILMGIFYSWLTQRSGSIWPATLAHMLQDHISVGMAALFIPEAVLEQIDGMTNFYCSLAVILPLAVLILWAMLRRQRIDEKRKQVIPS